MTEILTPIDLTALKPPDIVENLDYETLLQNILNDFKNYYPEYDAILESDPAYKLLQVFAYRELILRQRINDAARSNMLSFAVGNDLENLAANLGVQRLILENDDEDSEPEYESDERLRARVQLALEAVSTAGPKGAYIFHALSASELVKDVSVESPSPGTVVVTILSHQDNGIADDELLQTVNAAITADNVRPLTDHVITQSAGLVYWDFNATLYLSSEPMAEVIQETVQQAVQSYIESTHYLGAKVSLSGLYAACHLDGVKEVVIAAPIETMTTLSHQAPLCSSINIDAIYD